MTWHYSITSNGSELKVWDHTQDPATDTPIKTLQNDGSVFTIPNDVLAVMDDEASSELPEQANAGNAGNGEGLSQRGGFILKDMARQNIKEVDN